MKRYLYKISLFLALPFAVAFFLDRLITHTLVLSKEFPCENEVWNDIYSSSIQADIAVYGSSRAWVHFDPALVEDTLKMSCYNFGEDGADIMQQYIRHREYMRLNPPPKLVILSVDMWTLSKRDHYPSTRFYPYSLGNTHVAALLEASGRNYDKKDFYLPLLRYIKARRLLRSVFKQRQQPYFESFDTHFTLNRQGRFRHNGYRGMELAWKNDSYADITEYNASTDTSSVALLEKFIRELQQAGISIFMVYPPEYADGQRIIRNREAVMTIFNMLSLKYHIPFIDYSDNGISRRKELFYNVHHLNKTGAELFTRSFVSGLKARTGSLQ